MTRLYRIYNHMKSRCYNPNSTQYKWYGERGITICDEWLRSYDLFEKWAFTHGYRDDLTIDRIDVNKGYSPDNCRWVSKKEQSNNKRNNIVIMYKDKAKTLKQWCEELGRSYKTVWHRIHDLHWSVERALETKEKASYNLIEYKGQKKLLTIWCKELGLKLSKVYARLYKSGWSVERAFETR